MDNKVSDMMGVTLEKIRTMVDASTIVGNPINTLNGTTIIPVSKVTYGFGSGGSEFDGKVSSHQNFGGGSGAGISVTPIAFIVVSENETKILPITSANNTAEKAIALVPDVIDKLAGYIKEAIDAKKSKEDDEGIRWKRRRKEKEDIEDFEE